MIASFDYHSPTSLEETFDLLAKLQNLFAQLQEADAAPRPNVKAAVADVVRDAPNVADRWQKLIASDLAALNAQLKTAQLDEINVTKS